MGNFCFAKDHMTMVPVAVHQDAREGGIDCEGNVEAETRDIYPRTSVQTNGGNISLNYFQ